MPRPDRGWNQRGPNQDKGEGGDPQANDHGVVAELAASAAARPLPSARVRRAGR